MIAKPTCLASVEKPPTAASSSHLPLMPAPFPRFPSFPSFPSFHSSRSVGFATRNAEGGSAQISTLAPFAPRGIAFRHPATHVAGPTTSLGCSPTMSSRLHKFGSHPSWPPFVTAGQADRNPCSEQARRRQAQRRQAFPTIRLGLVRPHLPRLSRPELSCVRSPTFTNDRPHFRVGHHAGRAINLAPMSQCQ